MSQTLPMPNPQAPDRMQELIDLLIRVLELTRGTDMREAISEFNASLTEVLVQLDRIARELQTLIPATEIRALIEARMTAMDRQLSRMEPMLARLHDEMMAPEDGRG